MASNQTTRYSKVSTPNGLLSGEEIVAIGKPDPLNTETGWGVYRTAISSLSFYFVSKFREEGLNGNISLGDGIMGDGSPGSLAIDPDYINQYAIRHDRLDITIVGNPRLEKLPIVARENPSSSFVVKTTDFIPVKIYSAVGYIPPQEWDLANYGTAQNTTFFWYAVHNASKVTSEIRTVPRDESVFETLIAVIKTNDTGISEIIATPFSRLGLYRISALPRGSSVAGTDGPFANTVDRFWQTRWYGDQSDGGDWEDIYIPETIIYGPVTQSMKLAPKAKFEILVYGPGGGGGSTRRETASRPGAAGESAGQAHIRLNGVEFISFFNVAGGGTDGNYRNNFYSENGNGGIGGGVSQVGEVPAGASINRMLSAKGKSGKGGRDFRWNGGDRGTLTAPSGEVIPPYLPDLSGYGNGGEGVPGMVTSEKGLGGGGGGGAAFYMMLENVGDIPISIVVDLGAAGKGGVADRNGKDGQQAAAWFRQLST